MKKEKIINKITRGGGGEVTHCFLPSFLDPLRLPVWGHIVTGQTRVAWTNKQGIPQLLGRAKSRKSEEASKYRAIYH